MPTTTDIPQQFMSLDEYCLKTWDLNYAGYVKAMAGDDAKLAKQAKDNLTYGWEEYLNSQIPVVPDPPAGMEPVSPFLKELGLLRSTPLWFVVLAGGVRVLDPKKVTGTKKADGRYYATPEGMRRAPVLAPSMILMHLIKSHGRAKALKIIRCPGLNPGSLPIKKPEHKDANRTWARAVDGVADCIGDEIPFVVPMATERKVSLAALEEWAAKRLAEMAPERRSIVLPPEVERTPASFNRLAETAYDRLVDSAATVEKIHLSDVQIEPAPSAEWETVKTMTDGTVMLISNGKLWRAKCLVDLD